jgi:transposase
VRAAIEVNLDLIQHYGRLIAKLELHLENHAKVQDPQTFYRLMSIPGVGRVLAMTMLYEIHKIERFGSVGDFLS